MATLSPSFPPSGTAAFYFINRPPMPNILTGSVQHVHGLFGPEKNKENHFFFKTTSWSLLSKLFYCGHTISWRIMLDCFPVCVCMSKQNTKKTHNTRRALHNYRKMFLPNSKFLTLKGNNWTSGETDCADQPMNTCWVTMWRT